MCIRYFISLYLIYFIHRYKAPLLKQLHKSPDIGYHKLLGSFRIICQNQTQNTVCIHYFIILYSTYFIHRYSTVKPIIHFLNQYYMITVITATKMEKHHFNYQFPVCKIEHRHGNEGSTSNKTVYRTSHCMNKDVDLCININDKTKRYL